MVDLKAIPPLVLADGNDWSNWSAEPARRPATDADFKGAGSTETRVSRVRAGLRLEVPKSLTVDQVQIVDGIGPSATR